MRNSKINFLILFILFNFSLLIFSSCNSEAVSSSEPSSFENNGLYSALENEGDEQNEWEEGPINMNGGGGGDWPPFEGPYAQFSYTNRGPFSFEISTQIINGGNNVSHFLNKSDISFEGIYCITPDPLIETVITAIYTKPAGSNLPDPSKVTYKWYRALPGGGQERISSTNSVTLSNLTAVQHLRLVARDTKAGENHVYETDVWIDSSNPPN